MGFWSKAPMADYEGLMADRRNQGREGAKILKIDQV